MLRALFRALPEGWMSTARSFRSSIDYWAAMVRRPRRLVRRLLRTDAAARRSDRFPDGVVSITFDDDLVDAYDKALPMMDAYGWGGTGYFLVATLGEGLTLEQLHRMEDHHGWEIAGHGFTRHVALTALPSNEVASELLAVRQWLVEHGFRGHRHFAYPYSANDRSVREVARGIFQTARVVVGGAGVSIPPEPSRLDRLGAFTWGAGYATVTSLTRELDRVRAEGGWAILVFHGIDRPDAYSISSAAFSEILAHIDSLGMVVLPVGDVMRACTATE